MGDFEVSENNHSHQSSRCYKGDMKENNKVGKTRDLVKKIKDIMGTFHAKMGSIEMVWT